MENSKPPYRLSKMITAPYFGLAHKKLSVFWFTSTKQRLRNGRDFYIDETAVFLKVFVN